MKVGFWCVVLDSGDSERLSDFYSELLGWKKFKPNAEFIMVFDESKEGAPFLLFQEIENYEPPVWPSTPGRQQTMAHLDFHVDDIGEGVKHAISCGAKLAGSQFDDSWRVLIDPAGHPFCICAMPAPPPG
jgi:catechol 2,3-dioxygenase-like lactoylglutathione lyase family enzyme